jgi:3-phosphoglycerate kinase
MKVRGIKEINAIKKKVIVRVDFNVPIEDNKIKDNTKIIRSLDTIKYLLDQGSIIILISHLGRPKGKRNPKYTLEPVHKELERLLKREIIFHKECIGEGIKKLVKGATSGDIILLENIRFYEGEEKNDKKFSEELASLGDIFINDAFGTAHRAHSSTEGITHFLPSYAGFLMKKEIESLSKAFLSPEKPFLIIIGGSKVSTKIGIIDNLLDKSDTMIIGGAMVYTFLRAKGINTGNSLVEENMLEIAKNIISHAEENHIKFILPVDHIVAKEIRENASYKELPIEDTPDGYIGLDIGSKSIKLFSEEIRKSRMILWNGPLGVFEISPFDKGTISIAKEIASHNGNSMKIVGGGDTALAVRKAKVENSMSHISTGGGASLEFLEGKILPGIRPLIEE